MDKPVITDIPLMESIRKRWSPKIFSETPVSKEHLQQILVAASWAPSCFNAQPWSFIVGINEKQETFVKLSDCLSPLNRVWAVKAPVLMLAIAELNFPHNGNANRHASHDVGLALGNLLNQATMLGLQAHLMAGFSVELAKENFGLPDTHDPFTMLALGYKADIKLIPKEVLETELAPRSRKPLNEVVFAGSVQESFFTN